MARGGFSRTGGYVVLGAMAAPHSVENLEPPRIVAVHAAHFTVGVEATLAPRDVPELRRRVRLPVMRMRPLLIRSFVAAVHLYDLATDASGNTGPRALLVEVC